MERFLKSFDRKTPRGLRNYAVAVCLSELGLRAAEVAALNIDDLDWRGMTMRLRKTKQQRERLLPMPPEVARAVATYLKEGRPPATTRALFVRHQAPLGEAFKPHHVRSIVRGAFARCDIAYTGTHVLRHTWATRAHRRGINLKLLADVLGHRSLNTTTRYAHVNLEELRQVASPWPAERPHETDHDEPSPKLSGATAAAGF
jgi:integrase